MERFQKEQKRKGLSLRDNDAHDAGGFGTGRLIPAAGTGITTPAMAFSLIAYFDREARELGGVADSQVIKDWREEARITCAPGLTCTVICAAARGSLELAMQCRVVPGLTRQR